jgi:hypothetical protein
MITTALIFSNDGAPMPPGEDIGFAEVFAVIHEPLGNTPTAITQRICDLALDQIQKHLPRLHVFLGPNPSPWLVAGVMHAAITRQVQDVFVHRWDEARGEYFVINYI